MESITDSNNNNGTGTGSGQCDGENMVQLFCNSMSIDSSNARPHSSANSRMIKRYLIDPALYEGLTLLSFGIPTLYNQDEANSISLQLLTHLRNAIPDYNKSSYIGTNIFIFRGTTGSGKTYLANTLYSFLRSENAILCSNDSHHTIYQAGNQPIAVMLCNDSVQAAIHNQVQFIIIDNTNYDFDHFGRYIVDNTIGVRRIVLIEMDSTTSFDLLCSRSHVEASVKERLVELYSHIDPIDSVVKKTLIPDNSPLPNPFADKCLIVYRSDLEIIQPVFGKYVYSELPFFSALLTTFSDLASAPVLVKSRLLELPSMRKTLTNEFLHAISKLDKSTHPRQSLMSAVSLFNVSQNYNNQETDDSGYLGSINSRKFLRRGLSYVNIVDPSRYIDGVHSSEILTIGQRKFVEDPLDDKNASNYNINKDYYSSSSPITHFSFAEKIDGQSFYVTARFFGVPSLNNLRFVFSTRNYTIIVKDKQEVITLGEGRNDIDVFRIAMLWIQQITSKSPTFLNTLGVYLATLKYTMCFESTLPFRNMVVRSRPNAVPRFYFYGVVSSECLPADGPVILPSSSRVIQWVNKFVAFNSTMIDLLGEQNMHELTPSKHKEICTNALHSNAKEGYVIYYYADGKMVAMRKMKSLYYSLHRMVFMKLLAFAGDSNKMAQTGDAYTGINLLLKRVNEYIKQVDNGALPTDVSSLITYTVSMYGKLSMNFAGRFSAFSSYAEFVGHHFSGVPFPVTSLIYSRLHPDITPSPLSLSVMRLLNVSLDSVSTEVIDYKDVTLVTAANPLANTCVIACQVSSSIDLSDEYEIEVTIKRKSGEVFKLTQVASANNFYGNSSYNQDISNLLSTIGYSEAPSKSEDLSVAELARDQLNAVVNNAMGKMSEVANVPIIPSSINSFIPDLNVHTLQNPNRVYAEHWTHHFESKAPSKKYVENDGLNKTTACSRPLCLITDILGFVTRSLNSIVLSSSTIGDIRLSDKGRREMRQEVFNSSTWANYVSSRAKIVTPGSPLASAIQSNSKGVFVPDVTVEDILHPPFLDGRAYVRTGVPPLLIIAGPVDMAALAILVGYLNFLRIDVYTTTPISETVSGMLSDQKNFPKFRVLQYNSRLESELADSRKVLNNRHILFVHTFDAHAPEYVNPKTRDQYVVGHYVNVTQLAYHLSPNYLFLEVDIPYTLNGIDMKYKFGKSETPVISNGKLSIISSSLIMPTFGSYRSTTFWMHSSGNSSVNLESGLLDVHHMQDVLYYYNTETRASCWAHKLSVAGLCHCRDCTCFIRNIDQFTNREILFNVTWPKTSYHDEGILTKALSFIEDAPLKAQKILKNIYGNNRLRMIYGGICYVYNGLDVHYGASLPSIINKAEAQAISDGVTVQVSKKCSSADEVCNQVKLAIRTLEKARLGGMKVSPYDCRMLPSDSTFLPFVFDRSVASPSFGTFGHLLSITTSNGANVVIGKCTSVINSHGCVYAIYTTCSMTPPKHYSMREGNNVSYPYIVFVFMHSVVITIEIAYGNRLYAAHFPSAFKDVTGNSNMSISTEYGQPNIDVNNFINSVVRRVVSNNNSKSDVCNAFRWAPQHPNNVTFSFTSVNSEDRNVGTNILDVYHTVYGNTDEGVNAQTLFNSSLQKARDGYDRVINQTMNGTLCAYDGAAAYAKTECVLAGYEMNILRPANSIPLYVNRALYVNSFVPNADTRSSQRSIGYSRFHVDDRCYHACEYCSMLYNTRLEAVTCFSLHIGQNRRQLTPDGRVYTWLTVRNELDKYLKPGVRSLRSTIALQYSNVVELFRLATRKRFVRYVAVGTSYHVAYTYETMVDVIPSKFVNNVISSSQNAVVQLSSQVAWSDVSDTSSLVTPNDSISNVGAGYEAESYSNAYANSRKPRDQSKRGSDRDIQRQPRQHSRDSYNTRNQSQNRQGSITRQSQYYYDNGNQQQQSHLSQSNVEMVNTFSQNTARQSSRDRYLNRGESQHRSNSQQRANNEQRRRTPSRDRGQRQSSRDGYPRNDMNIQSVARAPRRIRNHHGNRYRHSENSQQQQQQPSNNQSRDNQQSQNVSSQHQSNRVYDVPAPGPHQRTSNARTGNPDDFRHRHAPMIAPVYSSVYTSVSQHAGIDVVPSRKLK